MNLLKAASTVSLLTLASRVSGLVREQLVAASFGASGFTDAYNVAFRIPNLLRRLFAEGAFSQAFVPLLANSRIAEGDEVTHRLIDAVATVLAWTLLATCVIGVGAPVSGSSPDAALGNAITSRIVSRPASSISVLSQPNAIPPCGGAP